MIVVFKMADLPVNVQKWKLSYFQATYKYANCVQFMLYIAMYLNHIVLSQQCCVIWVIFVAKWTLGLHFICTKKSLSPWKNTTFVFNRKIRHFPDLRVTQDFLCIEPEVLPTTYKKISIVTKWVFLWLNSLEVCWAPKNFRLSAVPTGPIKDLSTFDKWKLLHINCHVFVFHMVYGVIILINALMK